MTTLRDATDVEIADELKRREALNARADMPRVKDSINWGPVIDVAVQYREFVAGDEFCDDNDFDHYICEAAVEAVFGKEFWAWHNARVC